jgi:hypothetical protein
LNGLSSHAAKASALFLLAFVVFGLVLGGRFCVRGADEVQSSVGDADVAVRQAFDAALEAERVGANVSGLIVRLNEAGGILGEAEIAVRNGNSSEAASKVEQCIGLAESVRNDANALKASALDQAQTVFKMYLAFSVVSIAVFVVVVVFFWRWFKRGYVRRMLGMRPEVTSGAEA